MSKLRPFHIAFPIKNIDDTIKYKIHISKKISHLSSVGFFIVNNNKNIGLGANISFCL